MLLLAAAVVALLANVADAAAPAPLSGCFASAALGLGPATASSSSPEACSDSCSGGDVKLPLSAVVDGVCRCIGVVPPASAAAPCGAPGSVRLYYHSPAPGAACRLANVDLGAPGALQVSYNPRRASASSSSELEIEMDGLDGARVVTADGDHMYGLWQVDVAPSAAVGAVTAA